MHLLLLLVFHWTQHLSVVYLALLYILSDTIYLLHHLAMMPKTINLFPQLAILNDTISLLLHSMLPDIFYL